MMTQVVMGLITGCRDDGAIFSRESCSGEPEKFSSMMASFPGDGTFRMEENQGEDRLKRLFTNNRSIAENDPDLSVQLPLPAEDNLDSSGLPGALHVSADAADAAETIETIETIEVFPFWGRPEYHALEKIEGKGKGAGSPNPVPGMPAGGEHSEKLAGKAAFFQSQRENDLMPAGEIRREEMTLASTRQADVPQAKGVEGSAREDVAEHSKVLESGRKSVDRETVLKTSVSGSESNSGTPAGGSGQGVAGTGGNVKHEPQPAPATAEFRAPAGSGSGAGAPAPAPGNTENTEQRFQGGREFKDGSEGLGGAERIGPEKPATAEFRAPAGSGSGAGAPAPAAGNTEKTGWDFQGGQEFKQGSEESRSTERIGPEKSAGESSATNAAKDEDTRTKQTARLVAGAVLKARGGSRAIEIQMKPEVLGRLRIELSINGKQADVRMITEGIAAKEAIEQSIAQIRADLQRHGLDLQRFDVQLGGSFGSGAGPDGRAGGRSPAGHRAEEPRRKENEAAVTAPSGEDATGEGLNRVDYFA